MGAGELLIIGVLGLLILGPERLPVAIRTVSSWIRTIKQMANSVSAEMSHELKVHELHQNLKKAEQQGMKGLSSELTDSVEELKDAAASVTRPYQKTPNPTPLAKSATGTSSCKLPSTANDVVVTEPTNLMKNKSDE